jgi:alanine dehydrogenase
MIIGCPKETKAFENRVGIVPAAVRELVALSATVLVEKNAGLGSGIKNQEYLDAGAIVVDTAAEVWGRSEMIVKVKEPLAPEFEFMRKGQVVFTFLHLAAEPALAQAMLQKEVMGIAYETIEDHGGLPLLRPSSEVAGRMAIQVGAWCLENQNGGKGMLLGGVPGVRRGRVMILGGGVVGKNAAKVAVGMGADVVVYDNNLDRLDELDDIFLGRVGTMFSNEHNIASHIGSFDLVIGAVLLPGARAPRLVTRQMVQQMEPGSVVMDVSVDQGGCIETVHRTMHDAPIYIQDQVVHYGVANMPGAVARTSTFALTNATFPYLRLLARKGVHQALSESKALQSGLNTVAGKITHVRVAQALGLDYHDPQSILGI